jgi:hypothetical protein
VPGRNCPLTRCQAATGIPELSGSCVLTGAGVVRRARAIMRSGCSGTRKSKIMWSTRSGFCSGAPCPVPGMPTMGGLLSEATSRLTLWPTLP